MYLLDFTREFLKDIPESKYTPDYIHKTNTNCLIYTSLVDKYNQQLENYTIKNNKYYFKWSNIDIELIKFQIKKLIKEQQVMFSDFNTLLLL